MICNYVMPTYAKLVEPTEELQIKLKLLGGYDFSIVNKILSTKNDFETYDSKEFSEVFIDDIELSKMFYFYYSQLLCINELTELNKYFIDLEIIPDLLNKYNTSLWNKVSIRKKIENVISPYRSYMIKLIKSIEI